MASSSDENSHIYENFPFVPYPQQKHLMSSLYDCINDGCMGCFESPTGTGKSLSTMFASLGWLQEEETRRAKELAESQKLATSASPNDWLAEMQNAHTSTADQRKSRALERLNAAKDRIRQRLRQVESNHGMLLRTKHPGVDVRPSQDRRLFSAAAGASTGSKQMSGAPSDDEFAASGNGSSDDGNSSGDATDSDEEDFKSNYPQVLFCSRTHSQLTQFVNELKKSAFSSVRCVVLGGRRNLCVNPSVNALKSDAAMTEKCSKLRNGSRKSSAVSLTPSTSTSIERDELSCSFKNKRQEFAMADLILGKVMDIEDVAAAGKRNHVCPYYSTRRAIRYAQVICMPYNLLLSQDLRASLGLELSGRAVIIDEAHNLVETINQIHSAELYLSQLDVCRDAVTRYLERFRNQLSGKNTYFLTLLSTVISHLIRYLESNAQPHCEEKGAHCLQGDTMGHHDELSSLSIMSVNDFVFASSLDNINILKLRGHLLKNNMINRIAGFMEHTQVKAMKLLISQAEPTVAIKKMKTSTHSSRTKGTLTMGLSQQLDEDAGAAAGQSGGEKSAPTLSMPSTSINYNFALRGLMDLLRCLSNNDVDGRVVVYGPNSARSSQGADETAGEKESGVGRNSHLKFVLLNPSEPFKPIVHQAKSVCLLGGTMQPFDYIVSQLFASVPRERVRTFSCSHVVHSSHVCPLILTTGRSSGLLELTHNKRSNHTILDDIISSLLAICRRVPHGIVVFFTSYAYMESVITEWQRMGYLRLLASIKPLFVEPRSAADTDSVLCAYSEQVAPKASEASARQFSSASPVETSHGAILFCVMGGKLSEGINFSDNLARCVVVVGLPYPDKRDPILQLKLNFADRQKVNGGKALYEALCMRAVNQSIGRSIRHAGDFAAMVLIDSRYAHEHIKSLLPGWIQQSISTCRSSAQVDEKLNNFFKSFAEVLKGSAHEHI